MTRKLPKPLVHDLVAVADLLARPTGAANFRQASMRHAVSSAYYALFHSLCFVCADALVGWSRTSELEPIYQSLDHAASHKRLNSNEAKRIDPRIESIGTLFATLQELRYAADYAPPSSLFSRTQALDCIGDARTAIALIEELDAQARLALAILLIARQRVA